METKPKPKPHPVLKDKDQIKYYYDVILPMLAKYQHTSTPEWVELLVEQCLAEKNFDQGMKMFLEHIQQNGLEIEADQRKIMEDKEKLFRLRFLRKMIHAMGLGFLEEQILGEEAEKLFRAFPAPPASPNRRKGRA